MVTNTCIAIVTKYLGPTNTRGARIKAYMPDMPERSAVVVPYAHELDQFRAHERAATAFALRHDLKGDAVAASLERGYVFTFTDNFFGVRNLAAGSVE